MTISIKHAFTSTKDDPLDTTIVRPSNWNEEHDLTMASAKVLGRASAGSGAVEELTFTAFAQTLATYTDAAALLAALGVSSFTTGDIKATVKTTADSGWIMANDGTIGDASSGASNRANADTADLYALLWNNISDTYAPVTGGRGANAAADFAAHKKIALPKMAGRAIGAAGSGSGLTSRSLGETTGEETHVLTEAEMATHTHSLTDPGHTHTVTHNANSGGNSISGGAGTAGYITPATITINSATTGITLGDAGSDTAHNNMQPTSFHYFMIKL